MAPVSHLFPFRTEKLSPDAPMVLPNPRESRSPPFFESPAAREIRCGALFRRVPEKESAGGVSVIAVSACTCVTSGAPVVAISARGSAALFRASQVAPLRSCFQAVGL